MNAWRTWNGKVKQLEKDYDIILQENKILWQEIKMLKKLVFDLEIEYTALLRRK
jgi:hypothetical protein